METHTTQTIVKVVAILHFILAGFAVVLALFMAASWTSTSSNDMNGLIAAIGVMLTIIVAFFTFLYASIGYGLWNVKNWGRVVLLIGSWFSVVCALLATLNLLGVLPGFLFRDLVAVIFFIITGGISAVLIWLFQFQPDVVALFKTPKTAQTR